MDTVEEMKKPLGLKIIAVFFGLMYWFTVVAIVFAIFLWRGKNWARISVVIVCGLFSFLIFFTGFAVFGAVETIVFLAVNIGIVWYLLANRTVKKYFGRY